MQEEVKMKVGTPIKITYQAAGSTTGLTDVIAKILDETGSPDLVNFADITLTESPDILGEYFGYFTPDAVGDWVAVCDSATKPGKLPKQYRVTAKDVDSLNDVSTTEVKTQADQALADYDVVKKSDISNPPVIA